jgi:hypothetical protein
MTARNVCIDVVTAELRAVGITYEIAHGGKHPQVHFSINGMRRFYVVPRTPSDWRAAQNARAGVRGCCGRISYSRGSIRREPTALRRRRRKSRRRQTLKPRFERHANPVSATPDNVAKHKRRP